MNDYLAELDNEVKWVNENLIKKKKPTDEEKKALEMIKQMLEMYKNGHCAMLLIAIAGIQGIKIELFKTKKK